MALKSLVDTPYYKIDSVIYRLKKELEDVDFKQENKLTGTNDMLEPQVIIILKNCTEEKIAIVQW